jgi:hypothetical protein
LAKEKGGSEVKKIKFLLSGIIHTSTEPVSIQDAFALMNIARTNKLRVIEGALATETEINQIIAHWFFGRGHERKPAFESLILDSDWCSFAAKRKLLTHIIEDGGFLQGEAKNEFYSKLQKVMSYRNAFTHGKLSSDGKAVWLSYFEAKPKRTELTDDFLTIVESTLLDCYAAVQELAQKCGATIMSDLGNSPVQ